MAQQVEPMDIDSSVCDFDNKENSFHHNNVPPRTPCTEKGYEELDVSELNMKLRYSVTPAASPMSKSFTASCLDNRNVEPDSTLHCENGNMTRSLHSTLKNESTAKVQKLLPLQVLSTDQGQIMDGNRNALRSLDAMATLTNNNVTVTVSGPNDIDENISLPSSSSSLAHTPEATTPTKELPKGDTSPIIRGLKSVLNMFRPSQSPIPLEDEAKAETLSPPIVISPDTSEKSQSQAVSASTPLTSQKTKDPLTKSSPNRDSLVFNDDLETELQWKDDSTIIFSKEKVPIHKLFFQNTKTEANIAEMARTNDVENKKLDASVQFMDISYNDSGLVEKSVAKTVESISKSELNAESDSEFLDCESTFNKMESFFEESFKSQEEQYTFEKEKIIDIKTENLNNTTETLNDLTDASTETTANNSIVADLKTEASIDIVAAEANKNIGESSGIKPAEENIDFATLVLHKDEKEITTVTTTMVNVKENIESAVSNISTNNFSVPENVICSLAQIPLIVDPKVLLFNIPFDTVDKESKNVSDELNTTPADVPLPDDGDVDNMSPVSPAIVSVDEILQKVDTSKADVLVNSTVLTNNNAPALLSDISLIQDTNALEENAILSQTTSHNDTVLQSIDDLINEIDLNKSPVLKTIQEDVQSQNLEASDISVDEVKLDVVEKVEHITETTKKDVANSDAFIPEVEVIPDTPFIRINAETRIPDFGKAEENEKHEMTIENKIKTNVDIVNSSESNEKPQISAEQATESEMVRKIGSDIESIKYEVEAIVATAMDIVAIKETDIKSELLDISSEVFNKYPEVNIESTTDIQFGDCKMSSEGTEESQKAEMVEISTPPDCAVQDEIITTPVKEKVKVDQFIESTQKVVEGVEQGIVKTDIENQQPQINYIVTHKEEDNTFGSVQTTHVELEEPVANANADVKTEVSVLCKPLDSTTEVILQESVENITGKQLTPEIETPQKLSVNTENVDEEIVVSENGSPFVSVSAEVESSEEVKSESFEDIESPFATKGNVVVSPPISPKIASKGYNFNFDEIDDPFATKTKIRQSPPPVESPNHSFEHFEIEKEMPKKEFNKNNRRSLQPQGRKPTHTNKKLNSTYAGNSNLDKKISFKAEVAPPAKSEPLENCNEKEIPIVVKDKTVTIHEENKVKEITKKEMIQETVPSNTTQNELSVENKSPIESADVEEANKQVSSSSEQSAFCSAVASLNESIEPKNAFNLPELDDPNFNPFATKSKMRQSPPRDVAIDQFATKSKIRKSPTLDTIDPFVTRSKIVVTPEASMISVQVDEAHDVDATMTVEASNEISPDNVMVEEKCGMQPVDVTMTIEYLNKISPDNINFEQIAESQATDVTMTVGKDPVPPYNVTNKTDSETQPADVTIQDPIEIISAVDKKEFDVTLNNSDSTVKTDEADTLEGPFLEAEDFDNDDKMSEFDGDNVDVMQYSELLPSNDGLTEAGEMFIDAEAFEFLLNQNQTHTIADSGKESLFLKFDPLFAKRISSNGVSAAFKKVHPRGSTPKKVERPETDITFGKSPVAGPSTMNVTHDVNTSNTTDESYDDLNVTVSKPMMVVNPAVNPVVTPRTKSTTPVRSNRQSLTFTSPAIAVIDRLLNMSANSSLDSHNSTISEVRRDNEADLALTQLRELLADKEISVYNLRSESKELKDRLANLEFQMKSLEAISVERLKKINELNDKLTEKTKMNKSMAKVVEEYERTIASLITETEQDRNRHAEERKQLIKERDEQTAHLASMEVSFSDLHSKYEKTKQVILGFKANEDSYRKSVKEHEENLEKMQNNYELLKQHATAKLTHANEELQKINRAHESDVLKLNALIKRKELHITSLEETLQQKTKANEELTAICDELINKVG